MVPLGPQGRLADKQKMDIRDGVGRRVALQLDVRLENDGKSWLDFFSESERINVSFL